MIINHYGITVDSEKPIVGVINNSAISQFIADTELNGIDLDWEEHCQECHEYLEHDECNCEISRNTVLIGDWIKDKDGKYTHKPEGEYAAIVNEIYTQVVFSKYTKRCALCSPCFPGQGDIDTPGDFLSYDLPPEAYEV